jgi:beta-N-acetylhexosaminidase
MTPAMALGAVMVDVGGLALTAEERARLAHPAVGGVILFARNYASPSQLRALAAEIAALREPPLLIGVDQEGGRVQRFVDGFTRLPAPRAIGAAYDADATRGLQAAWGAGYVMASELLDHGVGLSFAPVLDIEYGRSSVIGDRSLHREPAVVAQLAVRMIEGMQDAGMGAVGKHFPGHGYAAADSHVDAPVDERPLGVLRGADLVPYAAAIGHGLAGVMPAHVCYPAVDTRPAGFSSAWLQGVLREQLGFRGVIFSDDLSMEGAGVAGDIHARGAAAFDAGCDMVLICNAPGPAAEFLAGTPPRPVAADRLAMLRPAPDPRIARRRRDDYLAARRALTLV